MFSSLWAFVRLFFRWLFRKKGGQMAYSISWDESSPAGASTQAATIDTELQQLKQSVRERMNDLLDSSTVWETDGDNPKLLDVTALAGTPKAAHAGTNTGLSIPDGSITALAYAQEVFDTGTFHDNSTNNTRMTIAIAGYYRLSANVGLVSGSSAGAASVTIRKGGSSGLVTNIAVFGTVENQTIAISVIVLAAATDYYEVTVLQNTGQTFTSLNGNANCNFMIEKLDGTT